MLVRGRRKGGDAGVAPRGHSTDIDTVAPLVKISYF